MITVKLVPHNIMYAEVMSQLSSAPEVKDALGLSDEQVSLEGTKGFIDFILKQEADKKQYSRMMLNEEDKLIGVITLKELDHVAKTSHIGTWIGHEFWGRGYNELAKEKILHTGFTELGLDYIFAGAKVVNIRSQKAQEKLPYIKLDVAAEFPLEHKKLEEQTGASCILNVMEKAVFLDWYQNKSKERKGMKIRKAQLEDASGIAKVHVDCWRTTYKNIMPEDFLRNLSYEKRTENWKRNIQQKDNYTFVAENEDGEIIGFADGGKRETNTVENSGDLTSIYILESYQKQGIGKKLCRPLFQVFRELGYKTIFVEVLEDNKSKYFYEALGAKPFHVEEIEVGGKERAAVKLLTYEWTDIRHI